MIGSVCGVANSCAGLRVGRRVSHTRKDRSKCALINEALKEEIYRRIGSLK